MSVKRKSKNPSDSWTVKDLKNFIKEKTAEAKQKIKEFEELEYKGLEGRYFRESVEKLRKISGTKSKNRNTISAGLNKKKKDLLRQAKELANFGKRKSTQQVHTKVVQQRKNKEYEAWKREFDERIERESKTKLGDDGYTDEEREYFDRVNKANEEAWAKEREEFEKVLTGEPLPKDKPFSDPKKERAYDTFNDRYYDGTLTREEYDNLIDTWNSVKDYLKSFGYERRSGDYTPDTNADIAGNIQDYAEIYTPEEIAEGMREVTEMRDARANDPNHPEFWTPQRMLLELEIYLEQNFGSEDDFYEG